MPTQKTLNILIGIILLIILIHVVFIIYYFSTQPTGYTVKQEPLKIGVTLPLSGGAVSLGENAKNGIELALQELGRNNSFKIIYEDDQFDSQKTVSAYNKLISIDNADYIITMGSNNGNVIGPLAEKDKKVHVAIATDPKVLDNKFSVKHGSDPFELAKVMSDEVKKRNYKRIYILSTNHEGVLSIINEFKNQEGISEITIGDELIDPAESDFKTILTKVKEKNPDAILLEIIPGKVGLAAKQARELGISADLFSAVVFEDQNAINAAEGSLEDQWYVNSQVSEEFSEKYKKQFKSIPSREASNGYDAIMMINQAIKKVGDDSIKVNDYLHDLKEFDTGSIEGGTIVKNGNFINKAIVKVIRNNEFVKSHGFINENLKPIKIGAILPMTGQLSYIGEYFSEGMELAAEEINNDGGINGRKLGILYEDNEGDTAKSLSAYKSLKLKDVDIYTTTLSSATLGVAPLAEKDKNILFNIGSASPKISDAGDYIFRHNLLPQDEASFLSEYISKNYDKIALITVNTEGGIGARDEFKKNFEELGIEVIADELHDYGEKDFRSILNKVKSKNPDAILVLNYANEKGYVLKQARELGIDSQWFSIYDSEDPKLLEIAGESAEGLIYSNFYDPTSPSIKEYRNKYKQKYSKEPETYSALSYDSIFVLAEAMKNCKNPEDTTCIKNELYKVEYEGVTGKITFDENGDTKKDIILKVIKNGEFVKYEDFENQEPIKIGVILPLSGEIANWGSSIQGGINLAVKEINDNGGINGGKLEIIWEDDQCDKAKAVTATQKLINVDNIKVIIGSVCSGSILAAAPIAENSEVIMLGFGSASAISDSGDYIFRHTYSDAYQGKFLAENIYNLGFKKVNAIYVNNDYGVGLFKGFRENFIEKGGFVINEQSYNFGATDFRTILSKIKNNQGEALVIIPYGKEGGLLLKQARELDIKLQVFSSDNFGAQDVIEAGGSAVEGVIFSSSVPLNEQDVQIKEFKNKYLELNGEEPKILFIAASGYDAINIVANAIRTSGYDSKKIKNYFYNMETYPGLGGAISFDKKGDSTKPFVFQTIKNGEFVRWEE